SRFAPVSNWLPKLPGVRAAMEKTVGVARERELPQFTSESLEEWFDARGGAAVPLAEAEAKVLLFPDTYTNYSHPRPGKAAVLVLEAAGVHVTIPDGVASSGRPAYSKGLLDVASERARTNVEALDPHVRDGWVVAFVEPSDAVMFQDEYLDLLPDSEAASRVAESAYGVLEHLDRHRLDGKIDFAAPDRSLTYHGHCNQKALGKDHHAVGVLRRAGYDVDPLDSGCCGMAGSFGYEAEHYDLSQAIGRILFDRIDASDGERVVAPGTSCRTQLGDRSGASRPRHPIEAVAVALDR
ncbi:FAD-binding oxidoreductase, partial [Halobacteriales archaeon SW_12_67_38]